MLSFSKWIEHSPSNSLLKIALGLPKNLQVGKPYRTVTWAYFQWISKIQSNKESIRDKNRGKYIQWSQRARPSDMTCTINVNSMIAFAFGIQCPKVKLINQRIYSWNHRMNPKSHYQWRGEHVSSMILGQHYPITESLIFVTRKRLVKYQRCKDSPGSIN